MKKFETKCMLKMLKAREMLKKTSNKLEGVLNSNAGNEQVGSVMNILIVIVIGAVLLSILYALFKGPINTGITNAITSIFGKFNSNLSAG